MFENRACWGSTGGMVDYSFGKLSDLRPAPQVHLNEI